MKTNKKLKLNTKKVVILSNDQQDSLQGGAVPTEQSRCKTDGICTPEEIEIRNFTRSNCI